MQIESTFTQIYENNLWGSNESVSGPGSALTYTANLRSKLPELLRQFSITSIFDAPCGDLNWMKHLLNEISVDYIGGDIVKPLIQSHLANYARKNVGFVHIDLTKDKFPQSDLMICRDCLFHLSYADTLSVLQNFIDSNIKFLLTTTHKKSNRVQNLDIATGGVRLIDLFAAPYHFPADVQFRIEDWIPPYQEREMCLWSRDQVIAARDALANHLAERDGTAPEMSSETLRANVSGVRALALSLDSEGRSKDALLLLEHLAALNPNDPETLRPLIRLMNGSGRTLEATEKLGELKAATLDLEAVLGDIEHQMPPAIKGFNDCLSSGDIEKAEAYAAALVALVPRNQALLNAALSCNLALGRKSAAEKYATVLISLDSAHESARATLAEAAKNVPGPENALEQKFTHVLSPKTELHPLLRLRDMHDLASEILCRPLTPRGAEQVNELLAAAGALDVNVPVGSEWEGWEKHYRLMLEAIDLSLVQGDTPEPAREADITLINSSGAALNWLQLRATAARLGAETLFFAAADRAYLDLYARSYIESILKNCDVPCLVIVHAIGAAGQLREIAKSIGIRDKRLVFSGDKFNAKSVATKCFDAPPKGQNAKPVAHLQSIRFLRLGSFLQRLKRPIFVSDIDLLLQRGVKDLLARAKDMDVMFNENETNTNAGSRLTANLMLVQPTDNAALFLKFLRAYLEKMLGKREVTRWIDQLVLLLARHHLSLKAHEPRLGYFDTASDINNVMYPAYQENPFRFLSLYHGFDMSSLTPKQGAQAGKPKKTKETRSRKRPVKRQKRRSR